MQHQQGMLALWQQATIAFLDSIEERTRMHPAPVYEDGNKLAAVLGQRAIADISMQAKGVFAPLFKACGKRIEYLEQRQVVEFRQRGGEVARAAGL